MQANQCSRARVRGEQANLVGHGLPDELGYARAINVFQDAGDNIALTLYGADDWRFVGGHATLAASLIPVPIFVLAADPSLVNLDNAAKHRLRRDQRGPDFVAHGMGRLVAAEAHHALDLKGARSLLAGEHEVGDPEPVAEWLLGVFKDRPDQQRKPIAVWVAFLAKPMKRLVAGCVIQVGIAAARAMDAFRPAPRHQVALAGFLVPNRETGLKLGHCHLRNWFRALCHDVLPLSLSVGAYCHG